MSHQRGRYFTNGDKLIHTASGIVSPVTYVGINPDCPAGRPWGEHVVQGKSGRVYIVSDSALSRPRTLDSMVTEAARACVNVCDTRIFPLASDFEAIIRKAIADSKNASA
jgi:hypothetical protein